MQAAGAVMGHGRVSREGQDLAQQRAALRAVGCARLFEEKASGGSTAVSPSSGRWPVLLPRQPHRWSASRVPLRGS